MSEEGLREEMQLTFEPFRMINVRQLPCKLDQAHQVDSMLIQAVHTLELSNLDHVCDYYTSVALFYDVSVGSSTHPMAPPSAATPFPSCNGASVISNNTPIISHIDDPAIKLQTALQELLVYYPAMAGRLHINESTRRYEVRYISSTNSTAACSDHTAALKDDDEDAAFGVAFVTAQANTAFSSLGDVTNPHPSLDVLYPNPPKRNPYNETPPPLLHIQVTTFTCGSFSMAFTVSHLLTDGYGIAIFMKNLCSIAKGDGLAVTMDTMNRREVLKPREPPSPSLALLPQFLTLKQQDEKELPYGVATRFSFNARALEALRLRAFHPNAKPCSRFQALVAFLWITRAKCLASSGSSPKSECPLRFPVNIRRGEYPNIPQGYMGNAGFQCTVFATIQQLCETSFVDVVAMIASAIARGINNIQEQVQSDIDYLELQLQNGCVPHIDHAFLGMPSFVNLPFYDADCGWGRLTYCGRPSQQLGYRLIILDDPGSKCWNVLVVLSSQEERETFQEEFAALINASS